MPWFYFDLVVNGQSRDQGSMILEDIDGAREEADVLAHALRRAEPEIEGKDAYVRVVNDNEEEVCRWPLDPVPVWSIRSKQ